MPRKTSILFLAAFFVSFLEVPLSAQTAQKMENLLNEQAITWSKATAFALEASDRLVYANETEAFVFASERKWVPKNAMPEENAKLNGISLLLMEAFGVKGGLFYSMTKNPHYAYRELVFKDVIQIKSDPEMAVTGEEFIFMINRLLALKETEAEKAEDARQREEAARRRAEDERLAKEINAQLTAQKVADTSARVTTEGVTISLSNIQFMANSAELMDSEKTKLREIARILGNVPERRILVTGHTALAGTREEQQRTSQERARAVANYLVSLQARTAAEITTQGFGADRPVASNDTEAGMAQNRRVEITIQRTEGGR